MKKKTAPRLPQPLQTLNLFFLCVSTFLSFLSPHHPASFYDSLILSQFASMHELKVDFICPILSPLNSRFPHHYRFVLCGSDNGSNYTGSMSVPQQQQQQKQAGWSTRSPTPSHILTLSGESLLEDLFTVTRKLKHQGIKYCFSTRWHKAYGHFCVVVFTPNSSCKYFTKLEYVMWFQWDLMDSSLMVVLR